MAEKKADKKKKWSDLLWAVLFLAIGIACVMDGWKEIKAKSDYERTTGVICDNRIDSVSDVNGNKNWYACYQYQVDGVTYENWDCFREFKDRPKLNKKVSLYYDGDNPNTVTMGASMFTGIGILIIGIVFLLSGFMIFILTVNEKRKKR